MHVFFLHGKSTDSMPESLLRLIVPYWLLNSLSDNHLISDYAGVLYNDHVLTPRQNLQSRHLKLRSAMRECLTACLKNLGTLKTGNHNADNTT